MMSEEVTREDSTRVDSRRKRERDYEGYLLYETNRNLIGRMSPEDDRTTRRGVLSAKKKIPELNTACIEYYYYHSSDNSEDQSGYRENVGRVGGYAAGVAEGATLPIGSATPFGRGNQ